MASVSPHGSEYQMQCVGAVSTAGLFFVPDAGAQPDIGVVASSALGGHVNVGKPL